MKTITQFFSSIFSGFFDSVKPNAGKKFIKITGWFKKKDIFDHI